MSQYYFTVNEAEDERKHIATIIAWSDQEFHEKLHTACQQHFDESIDLHYLPSREDCLYGREQLIKVSVGEEYQTTIIVSQTWLY